MMASLAKTNSLSPERIITSPITGLLTKNHPHLSTEMINTTPDKSNNLVNSLDNDKLFKSSVESSSAVRETKTKRKEVYKFKTNWLVSSLAWSNEIGESFQLALSSYIEKYMNYVQIVRLAKDADEEEIRTISTFDHPYPVTKLLWIPRIPESNASQPCLLATTADYLRIWRIKDNIETGSNDKYINACNKSIDQVEIKLECLLNSNQGSKLCAPLTSFDWNEIDPRIIVTSSVDTTCAIWDIETSAIMGTVDDLTSAIRLRSQLVAHDHQVYDVSFSRSGTGRDVFVSSSGDGSARLFDLRRLSTSSILFEMDRGLHLDKRALVRVACSKRDPNLVSTFAINSNEIIILDTRKPGKPLSRLGNHTNNLNSMSWAPHSSHNLCSASDDCQALIWDLTKLPSPIDEPILAYRANGKINAISWSNVQPDWIAIGFQDYLELLRV